MHMAQTYKWLNIAKARYYTITVLKERSDKIVLNYAWGGCNSNRGGKKHLLARNEEEAQLYILSMMKRRKSRGYELVAPQLH